MRKKFTIIILLFFPLYFANALTTGNVYTDSIGNTHYQFSDGTSGYSYEDNVGTTHYQFSDGLYGNAYTDSIGSTHYYFDSLQKNKYVDGICVFPVGYTCTEESQYQEMYNGVKQGLGSCDDSGRRNSYFSLPSQYCTPEGIEKRIMEGSNGPWLKMCREGIDLYKTSKVTYEKCIQGENEKWEKYAQAQLKLLKHQIDLELSENNKSSCPNKSSVNANGGCQCDQGLVWNKQQTQCVECEKVYINTHYENINGKDGCYCDNGYSYSAITAKCNKNTSNFSNKIEEKQKENIIIKLNNKKEDNTLKEERKLSQSIDNKLSERLKGRILLQVENHGEAWYVNPKNNKKYYMASGNEAYNIMRYLGVGITNKDLEKIKADKNFAKKNSGKIFLQVEANGEAYYIDVGGNAHYLKDGSEAYNIMRELGLGITNNDLRKIDINEIN
jgi:hypothetical protein